MWFECPNVMSFAPSNAELIIPRSYAAERRSAIFTQGRATPTKTRRVPGGLGRSTDHRRHHCAAFGFGVRGAVGFGVVGGPAVRTVPPVTERPLVGTYIARSNSAPVGGLATAITGKACPPGSTDVEM